MEFWTVVPRARIQTLLPCLTTLALPISQITGLSLILIPIPSPPWISKS